MLDTLCQALNVGHIRLATSFWPVKISCCHYWALDDISFANLQWLYQGKHASWLTSASVPRADARLFVTRIFDHLRVARRDPRIGSSEVEDDCQTVQTLGEISH